MASTSVKLVRQRMIKSALPIWCGCSSMVEQKPSKLMTRVRFPSPAPPKSVRGTDVSEARERSERRPSTVRGTDFGGSREQGARRPPTRPAHNLPPVDSIAVARHWPRPIVRTIIGAEGIPSTSFGPSPPGEVAEWLKAADCKSARASVRWFESSPLHQSRKQVSPFRWQPRPELSWSKIGLPYVILENLEQAVLCLRQGSGSVR